MRPARANSAFDPHQELPSLPRTREWDPRIESWSKIASVLVVFGVLAYRFVSVDAHVSRGWTAWEVMQRMLPDNWNEYEMALQTSPVVTKTAINTCIYVIADWLAQILEGNEPLDFDAKRLARSGAIGLIFGPITCTYYEFSDAILDPYVVANRPLKIIMDQTAYAAAKYTLFVMMREMFSGTPADAAFTTARQSTWPLLQRGWRFWPAVHVITYSVIPPRHRVLWVNCADLVWVTILSLFKGEEDKAATAAAAEAAAVVEDDDDESDI